MTRVIALLLVSSLSIASANGAEPGTTAQQTIRVGAGSLSCGEWVAVHRKDASSETQADVLKRNMLVSWVQGYVVGAAEMFTVVVTQPTTDIELAANQQRYGTISGWVFDPPDHHAIEQWTTNYCTKNPLERVTVAALVLVNELIARRQEK